MDTATDLMPRLRSRYSPKRFDQSSLDQATLEALLDAARWAPSAYNEQPWRFHVALRERATAFERLLAALNEGNRAWAASAGALMITAARRERRRDGEVNPYAWHDVGQAVAHLSVAALDLGIQVHQMQGFNPARAREALSLPSGWDPVTAVAIGRPAGGEEERLSQRARLPLGDLLHLMA